MTVQELIDELEKIGDRSQLVWFESDEYLHFIGKVSNKRDRIVLESSEE